MINIVIIGFCFFRPMSMKGGAIFAILLFFSFGIFDFFALFSLVVRLTFLFQMCRNSSPIHFVMTM